MDGLVRRALTIGALGGIAGTHVSLVGMVGAFQGRDLIADIVTVGTVLPMIFIIIAGWVAARRRAATAPVSSAGTLTLGAVAGAAAGAVLALLAVAVVTIDVRWIFVNARPGLAETLQFGQGPAIGSLFLILGGAILGAGGAALHVLPRLVARSLSIAAMLKARATSRGSTWSAAPAAPRIAPPMMRMSEPTAGP